MTVTPEQLVSMTLGYIQQLDAAQKELEAALEEEVDYKDRLIRARAEAWRQVEGPNREYREAMVDEMTVDLLTASSFATAVAKYSMENVRNKRQQLSAIQTASNNVTEEAQFSRMGPDEHSVSVESERLGTTRRA